MVNCTGRMCCATYDDELVISGSVIKVLLLVMVDMHISIQFIILKEPQFILINGCYTYTHTDSMNTEAVLKAHF